MRKRLLLIGLVAALWIVGVAVSITIGPAEDADAEADAALVLGAAVDQAVPSPVFQERISHAIKLYKDGKVKRIVFTGGTSPEDSLSEAEAARVWAMTRDVPSNAILTETRSRTTMQNFQFVKPILADANVRTVLVVSDPLHMRRAMLMARSLDIEAEPSATRTSRYRSLTTQLPFLLRETYFLHHFWFLGQ